MTDDLLVLECPRCGGKLKDTDDRSVFRCVHCAFDVILRERRPLDVAPASPSPLVSSGSELRMYEEQLRRLKQELAKDSEFQGCGTFVIVATICAFLVQLFMRDAFATVVFGGIIGISLGLLALLWVKLTRKKSPRALALKAQIRELQSFIKKKNLGLR